MKRFFACMMSVVLAVGLMPFPAFASDAELGAASVGDEVAGDAVGSVDATFADANLYTAVIDQLEASGIQYSHDDAHRNVKLTAGENARFKTLVANHRHIKDISGLEQFTGLTWIDLSNNLVKTSAQFKGMKSLAYLDLYDNAVRDVSGLVGLAKLEHLNLGDNDEVNHTAMTGLDALETLTSLTWLDFSQNLTPEVTTHIKGLTALEHLNLARNDLADVYDLAGLVNVKELNLSWNDPLAGISAVGNMTELQRLDCSFTHLNRSYMKDDVDQYGTDKSGINALFVEPNNPNSKLKLTKLKKIDLLADWNTSFANDGGVNEVPNGHVRELYRMFKAGKLEEYGYFYTWLDVASDPNYKRYDGYAHIDPETGAKYITYEDFDAYCDGVHDDYCAIFNAHLFASTYGCEVRATIDASDAPDKIFHIFGYYDTLRDLIACNSIDWQDANFVVHDENIDHYPARHKQLMLLSIGPQGSTSKTTPKARTKTINNPVLNEGRSLGTSSTSIAGLSDQVDSALAELHDASNGGYDRFYIMVTNENKRQYKRHEGIGDIDFKGFAQWDGFTVDWQGNIETHNASTMLPNGVGALSDADYHVSEAIPAVQWDFEGITKVEIVPIPDEQTVVKNGHFVTIPLVHDAETPRDGGGKPDDYRRCLDFRFCANIEITNITQQLGYAETGYDHDELSGNYYGFFTMNDSADINFHDCTAWDRRTVTSSYGIQLSQLVNMRLTNVSASNPVESYLVGASGDRWGLTGDNYCKHLLFDHCTFGRIDAHMGFYDVAIRDCQLGTGGLCLTGQGPLTVERTETHSQSFLNLRSDYGSTWDGDAYLNDCTHHFTRSKSSQQPGNLVAVTARFDDEDQKTRHDFGYPIRHPRLHIKNFTLDDATFWGSDTNYYGTYGVVSNYVNGLHLYANGDEQGAYWPEVVEIDGFHLVNYENSLGYERHVRMPLRMYGPVLEQFEKGGYSIDGVTYNGKSLSADLAGGDELISVPFELVQEQRVGDDVVVASAIVNRRFSLDELGDKDIVIEYTGDEPDLAFTDQPTYYGSNSNWISLSPYFVEHRWNAGKNAYTEVAYFSNSEIRHRWDARKAEFPALGPIVRMNIRTFALESSISSESTGKVTEGRTQLLHVQLLDTQWGDWEQIEAPTCGSAGKEHRMSTNGGEQVREVAATGKHVSDQGSVTKAPTTAEKGVRMFKCSVCGEVLRTEDIPKLIEATAEEGQDESGGEAGEKPSDGVHSTDEIGESPTDEERIGADAGERGSEEYGAHDSEGDPQGGVVGKVVDAVEEKAPFGMHRLYNRWSGEHFYTSDEEEHAGLVGLGWTDEGTGWLAPSISDTPVFRMYNPYAGEHHYCMKADERDDLVAAGWTDEGIGWYSDDAETTPLYREYNPYEFSNNHNYTTDKAEHDGLVAMGWVDEGYAWYGL